LLGLTREK